MIQTLAIVAAAALALLLIYAATRPDVLHVERSTRIQAPAAKIHALIHDMQLFNTWNPYNQKDPNMKGTYSGPAAGPGATFDFEGNKNVGRGRIQITGSTPPSQVKMKLDMLAPIEGHNDIEFNLAPEGDATDVTWRMQGPTPYIGKLMGIFFNMDKMIGTDFANGLASLKTLAERR